MALKQAPNPVPAKQGRPLGSTKTQAEKDAAAAERRRKKKERGRQQAAMASFLQPANPEDSESESDTNEAQGDAGEAELPLPQHDGPARQDCYDYDDNRYFDDSAEDGFFDAVQEESEMQELAEDYEDDNMLPDEGDEPEESVMGQYIRALRKRLTIETNNKNPIDPNDAWLLHLLKEYNFTVPAYLAETTCKRLDIEFTEIGYYRDLVGWLPELELGKSIPCPNRCSSYC